MPRYPIKIIPSSSIRRILCTLSYLPFLWLSRPFLYGQIIPVDSLIRAAPITSTVQGNRVLFSAEMPPLLQMAGAPEAFYTYYWEFGDGNFSFEEQPDHIYEKKGTYTVNLWSTNNYDNGKPPASRPQTIQINQEETQPFLSASSSTFPAHENLLVRTNRDPLPDEEVVLITSYKNTKNYVTSGALYLFYNDRKFKDDNFTLEDTRLYHQESIVQAEEVFAGHQADDSDRFLASVKAFPLIFTPQLQDTTHLPLPMLVDHSNRLYRNAQKISFEHLEPGEERHFFRTLKTTPEMLKDTSATLTIRSIYVPDKNYGDYSVKDTEMEIVTSHDPNKMSSNGTFINYRRVRSKDLKYKIKFQNNGEGPARTIRLEVETPELLDKKSLQITDTYPQVPLCHQKESISYSCIDTLSTEDKLIFTFRNIYLPGSNQKNVADRDSTKGFVKYRLKFAPKHYKKKTKSRTAIYFDKNDPIYTNYATTRFSPGISIGAKAGYIYTPAYDNSKEFMMGATLSPFKSYRGYWQSEAFFSFASFKDFKESKIFEELESRQTILNQIEELQKTKSFSLYLVPISYHYNLADFFALETGVQLKLDLSSRLDKEGSIESSYYFIDDKGNEFTERRGDPEFYQEKGKPQYFRNFNSGVFVGMQVGNVRIGPSAGVRYVYNFSEPHAQLQFYALWKF